MFGSIPFITILILGQFYLGMKVVAWYVGPNGIENTDTVKYANHTGIKKEEILITDTRIV